MGSTYMDRAISGDATDIDDAIDEWHNGLDPRPLHEYLGMTENEYKLWAQNPKCLQEIIEARRSRLIPC